MQKPPDFSHSFILFIILLLSLNSSVLAKNNELSLVDIQRVVHIPVTKVKSANGEKISGLSLLAYSNGRLSPIPFQIDELDLEGFVYFKSSKVEINGFSSVFDGKDELLFMLGDSGDRKPANIKSDGELLAEISVKTTQGETQYVYLVKNSRLRSDKDYVRYSVKAGRVETDHYSLQVDPKNALNWKQFSWDEYTGIHPGDPLDTMKIRISAGVGSPFTRLTIGNKEMIAEPLESHDGPIRATTAYRLTAIVLGVPFMRMNMQIRRTAYNITYDVRLLMPKLRRKLLFSPSLTLSLDGNQLYGSEIRTALGPKAPAIVDGEQSTFENQLIEKGVNNEQNWIWAHTGDNFDIVSILRIPHPELPLGFFLVDNDKKKDKPERYLGQLPNVGYVIKDLPTEGLFYIQINLYFSNNLAGMDPDFYVNQMKNPPEISVKSR